MKLKSQILIFLLIFGVYGKIQDDNQAHQNVISEVGSSNGTTDSKEGKKESEVLEATLEERRVDEFPCFHADINQFCFEKEPTKGCECEQFRDAIICCNVTDILKSIGCLSMNASTYKNIHVINATQAEINVTQLNSLKQVDSLVITDGNVSRLVGQFARFSSIKFLNFSNNNITEINERAFMNLNQLKIVDLSANNLTKLPSLQNTTVDILGNSKISCINISAALEKDVKFFNKEKSLCESEVVYWFNDTASITISDVEKRKKLEYDCPEKCRCKPGHMQYTNIEENKKDHLIFISDVDCSNSGLIKLPTKLPENTYYLNITNNSISSLSALVTNDYYLNIKSLFADDNLITSIVDLEGSKFLENFTVLSLRNNKIKDIPYYILSNLEKNLNGKILYLGGNRLTCECHIVKNINHWRLINDCDKILCNNMQAKILELKETELCKSGIDDWANYIEYLIVIEVLLLIALFTKVSYDYYVFKKTGFLPFPASYIILYNQK
ncbi:hypothetical protein ACKWTF_015709 [Chironomus riparius]